ncbi:hypothetical protein EI94DRAFT_1698591 [Lactarius quietus]|nr:hypothetical protein EI94DRAFT_1698591 [Lactarius quietus]
MSWATLDEGGGSNDLTASESAGESGSTWPNEVSSKGAVRKTHQPNTKQVSMPNVMSWAILNEGGRFYRLSESENYDVGQVYQNTTGPLKTPMPYMSLHTWDRETQRHPGRPEQPHPKRSTQEVQAEKVHKVSVQAAREALRAQSIQEVAIVKSQLEVQVKEKLASTHHPPPTRKRKVTRPHTKAIGPTVTTAKGESYTQTITADGSAQHRDLPSE